MGHRPTGGSITTPGCVRRGKSSEWPGPWEGCAGSGFRVQRCLSAFSEKGKELGMARAVGRMRWFRLQGSTLSVGVQGWKLTERFVGSGLPEFLAKRKRNRGNHAGPDCQCVLV